MQTYGNRCPAAFAIRFLLQRLLHLHPQENGGTDRPPKRSGTTGENQHLQAERGHKPWMSIKKARDVVGYNVKNNFVNIIYTSQNRHSLVVFCSHFLHKLLLPEKTRTMLNQREESLYSHHWDSRFLNAVSRSSKTPWPLCVWTVDPGRHTVVKHWRTWLKILSNSNKV